MPPAGSGRQKTSRCGRRPAPASRRGRRFGAFGENSVICFPPNALFNEQYIHIGNGTLFGPQISLSAGMVPGQRMVTDPVIRVGDRCLIGKGSGIVGHLEIVIGNDVWTGHHVYITDQNHGYEDLDVPISLQVMPERPVHIGDGSWLGHGTVVLPGVTIGRHVVVGANSVVSPGSVIGRDCRMYPGTHWRGGVLPHRRIVKVRQTLEIVERR